MKDKMKARKLFGKKPNIEQPISTLENDKIMQNANSKSEDGSKTKRAY